MYFSKKCTAKPYYFLVIDATLTLANPSRFRKNLMMRLEMKNCNMILAEKQQKY